MNFIKRKTTKPGIDHSIEILEGYLEEWEIKMEKEFSNDPHSKERFRQCSWRDWRGYVAAIGHCVKLLKKENE